MKYRSLQTSLMKCTWEFRALLVQECWKTFFKEMMRIKVSVTDLLYPFSVQCLGIGRYSGAWTELYCIPVTDTYLSMSTGYVHWR